MTLVVLKVALNVVETVTPVMITAMQASILLFTVDFVVTGSNANITITIKIGSNDLYIWKFVIELKLIIVFDNNAFVAKQNAGTFVIVNHWAHVSEILEQEEEFELVDFEVEVSLVWNIFEETRYKTEAVKSCCRVSVIEYDIVFDQSGDLYSARERFA